MADATEEKPGLQVAVDNDGKSGSEDAAAESFRSQQFTKIEHSLGFWEALRLHYPAVLWCLFINLATVLKGMDAGIVSGVVGTDPFKEQYGYEYEGSYIIKASWLGAFNYANSVGALLAAFGVGYAYDRLGPRVLILICCVTSIAFVFLQFFSKTPAQLFAGQLLNGISIGFFPLIAAAYVGEVCPLALRGFAASMTNLAFVVGKFLSSGVLKGSAVLSDKYAYKIPLACQWSFPAILLLSVFFMPDPPYWLAKHKRYALAERAISRLATPAVDPTLKLAHVKQVLRLEQDLSHERSSSSLGKPSFTDCFRGPDLRRLIICIMAYNIQIFVGSNLFISYAVYFFQIAGLGVTWSYTMFLILTAIAFVGTCLSWWLLPYMGRRTAYLWGAAGLTVLCFLIGAVDLAPHTTSAPVWGQCALLLACNLIYDLTLGPYCYVLLAEVPSAKLRGMTIALSAVTVHAASIVILTIVPYMMNEDQGNWRGKIGFFFAGLGFLSTIYCFFCLPETRGRTFDELDILFERKVPSRKFGSYVIEDESIVGEEEDRVLEERSS